MFVLAVVVAVVGMAVGEDMHAEIDAKTDK